MILIQAVNEFVLACEADGLTPKSISWYQAMLKHLIAAFGERELTTITTQELRLLISQLRSQDTKYRDAPQHKEQAGRLSDATIASIVRAFHRFFAWCADEYDIENPMRRIKRHGYKPEPRGVVKADFVKLFEATTNDLTGIRDRALLATMADTGARLGGLLSIKVGLLDMPHRRALIQKKGGGLQYVWFTGITGAFIQHWLNERQHISDYLFTSVKGPQQLSQSGVHTVLKRLKKAAGVTGRVNPHAFRHAFAREYILSGGDISTLARLLGHSNINTTATFYTLFDVGELGEQHDKHSLLSDMNLTPPLTPENF